VISISPLGRTDDDPEPKAVVRTGIGLVRAEDGG